jgi:hypothetical protein
MGRRSGFCCGLWLAWGAAVLSATGCDEGAVGRPVVGEQQYTLTVEVTNDAGVVASLAADVYYLDEDGEFREADGTPCRITTPGAFGAIIPRSEGGIRIAVASFVGFDTPASLASCRFAAPSGVQTRDFDVVLVEALTPEGQPPLAQPNVEVTEVVIEVTTTTSTTLAD